MKLFPLFLCTILSSSLASAGNPTRWNIKNENSVSLYIQCVAPHPMGLSDPITIQALLSPHEMTDYVWDGWDNDGLGLNFANWICAVSDKANPLTVSSNQTTTFKTDSGEDIRLTVHRFGGGYKVYR